MLNVFHTPIATVVAAILDAVDGNLHMGHAGGDVMRAYEANHPDLLVTTYTRAITARDLIVDLASRLDELSRYGTDKTRRKR